MTAPTSAWDRLADLIEYPGEAYEARVDACLAAANAPEVVALLQRFRETVVADGPTSMQERYVDAFDFDPGCTLNMSWHLVGDAPERGALLSMLRNDLARAGVFERGELPDHLAMLLRLIGRYETGAASELAALIGPAIAQVHERLKAHDNPYAHVIDAAGRMVAASRAREERP